MRRLLRVVAAGSVRRPLAIAALVGAAALVAGATTSDRSGGESYLLRAVFDNGSGLRTGMDVRVSGIEIGRVRSISLDQSEPTMPRAIAEIEVEDPTAASFRRDGRCSIRSATLLGDRFVDCRLTEPGSPAAPPLRTVEVDGERQHLMPVERTSSPVDPDLFLDVFRLPARQRLSIVINELGAGLAGNGEALRAAVRRADPAFLQLGRALGVLSRQRQALGRLADSSDRVLAPLARERERLAGLFVHGNELFRAVGLRRDSLRETFRRMPTFLRELRPTLGELSGLAAEAGPALADLDAAGAQLSRATAALEPAGREGTRGLRALGEAAPAQLRGLELARPVFSQLARTTPVARPAWTDLERMLASLREAGGFERLVEAPMAVGLTSNGFDRFGYYSRANAVITTCTSYVVRTTATCVGTFEQAEPAQSASLDYLLGP
jgi:phospholipid/cholesterol/gamma-HCH transport system substrate-binding protein